jgi:hypothetical protein
MRENATILVFAPERKPHLERDELLGPSHISIEAIKKNLRTMMGDLEELVHSAQEGAGKLHLAHVDVQLAIAVDGSVGLLGTGVKTSTTGTLTVRLEPANSKSKQ